MSLELHGTIQRGDFRRHIDLSVSDGEVVTILGANGTGKSTLIHTVAGLTELANGSLVVDNVTWDAPSSNAWVLSENRHTAVVFQDVRLFPHLNSLQNVVFGLRTRGVKKAEAIQRGQHALTQVGAESLMKRAPDSLSGGERQRVALARALVLQARVVLLDEPFSAIDEASHQEFRELLPRIIRESGSIALMVTHDQIDASEISPRSLRL